MAEKLRIAVADDEPDMQDYFSRMLRHMGHNVVSVAATGTQLVRDCREFDPDLVITDIRMPDLDGIEAAVQIYHQAPIPVILVSAYHDADLIERAGADHVMAYLVKPIKHADLEPAIGLAMCRFRQFEAIRQEADDLRQALVDRKVIERAKGILMHRAALNESDAFRRLQKLASEKNLQLARLAESIVTAEEAAR